MKKSIALLVAAFALLFFAGCCKERPRACIGLGFPGRDTIPVTDSVRFNTCIEWDLFCKEVPENALYYWDFGDGDSAIGTNNTRVTHVWSSTGVYTVTLTVPNGKPDKATKLIVVTSASGPDYVGTYNTGIEFCINNTNPIIPNHLSTITSSGPNNITIHNLFNDGASIDCAVNGNSIAASVQSSLADTLIGTFSATHNILGIGYSKIDTIPNGCQMRLTRQ